MAMILKSEKHKGYLLKVGDPAGVAYLEINGVTHHLNQPYLQIKYVSGGDGNDRIFSGYEIYGLVFWFEEKKVTTNRLLRVLHEMGFHLTANALREEITKDFDLLSKSA